MTKRNNFYVEKLLNAPSFVFVALSTKWLDKIIAFSRLMCQDLEMMQLQSNGSEIKIPNNHVRSVNILFGLLSFEHNSWIFVLETKKNVPKVEI